VLLPSLPAAVHMTFTYSQHCTVCQYTADLTIAVPCLLVSLLLSCGCSAGYSESGCLCTSCPGVPQFLQTMHRTCYTGSATHSVCKAGCWCDSPTCVPTTPISGQSDRPMTTSSQTVTLGPRAFSTAGPVVWNTLLPELHHRSISLDCFRHLLKNGL